MIEEIHTCLEALKLRKMREIAEAELSGAGEEKQLQRLPAGAAAPGARG